jgi:hypothetical protein
LFSASATTRPSANVIVTVRKANAKFHTTIRRNEARIVGFVSTSEKLRRPTLTFQPCASGSPASSTNRPFSSSAVHVLPVSASVMQSQPASYVFCGEPSNACESPWLLMVPLAVGTPSVVMSSCRTPICETSRIV